MHIHARVQPVCIVLLRAALALLSFVLLAPIRAQEFIRTYSSLAAAGASSTEVCLVGRLHSKRNASNKLIFYDLIGSSAAEETSTADAQNDLTALTGYSPKVQIMATLDAAISSSAVDIPVATSAFRSLHHALRRGDIVHVRGKAMKTKVGELSIVPVEVRLLTPCWHEIPTKLTEPVSEGSMERGGVITCDEVEVARDHALTICASISFDSFACCPRVQNLRYRQRYLDMLVNRSTMRTFHLRSSVLSTLRSFLSSRRFIEVETPIVWTGHGGATAKPFITSSTALSSTATVLPLYLRIAPELFLKQLVIGGMERVYEVSKVFRNEGMNATHNPEFTTCEIYEAYKDYNDYMHFTEEMLTYIAQTTLKRTTIEITPKRTPSEEGDSTGEQPATITIDFAATPYKRIDVMEGLREAIGEGAKELPNPNEEGQYDANE
jgi:lysyl-tRNA synthetase class 2